MIDSVNESEYETIKIGNQIWLKENYHGIRFKNGDKIKQAKNAAEWEEFGLNKIPAWSYPDSISDRAVGIGKIYNWYAINDKRGLAPKGWRIPRQKDFEALDSFVEKSIGFYSGYGLKAKYGWLSESNGNDIVSFSAIPVNIRKHNGEFYGQNQGIYYKKMIMPFGGLLMLQMN